MEKGIIYCKDDPIEKVELEASILGQAIIKNYEDFYKESINILSQTQPLQKAGVELNLEQMKLNLKLMGKEISFDVDGQSYIKSSKKNIFILVSAEALYFALSKINKVAEKFDKNYLIMIIQLTNKFMIIKVNYRQQTIEYEIVGRA